MGDVCPLLEELGAAEVAGVLDLLSRSEALGSCVLSVPLSSLLGSVPLLCCFHCLVHVVAEGLRVSLDAFSGVVARVLASLDEFEVSDVVVPGVSVPVVDVIPFRDRSVIELPHDAVQAFVVSAEVALPWVEVVLLSVEDLRRNRTSVSHKSRNCFHPFEVLIR